MKIDFSTGKMENGLQKDFFCQLCAIQFGKKAVFDMHLSLVHEKTKEDEQEPLDSDKKISLKQSFCELCAIQFDKKSCL